MKVKTVEITRATDWGAGKLLQKGQVIQLGEVDANVLISLKRAILVGDSPLELEGHTREAELEKTVLKRGLKKR